MPNRHFTSAVAMLLAQQTFPLNTDCVEFCPVRGFETVLAVGCYELDVRNAKRKGQVTTLRLESKDEHHSLRTLSSQTRLPGVLDLNWCPASLHRRVLSVAAADGEVYLLNVSDDDLRIANRVSLSSALALSVDWTVATRLASSASDGSLACVSVTESSLVVDQIWKAHDLEVWSCATDRHHTDVVYSGSDDCCLKGWDIRTGATALFTDRKTHSAGVCTIASDPHAEHHLCTGSYDECLRLWDTREMSRPIMTQKVACGGGVWRLKYHPTKQSYLAAACMHDGFKLLSHSNAEWSIVQEYKAHGSLAYGVDWQHVPDADIIASCSFYDNLLHIWNGCSIASH